MKQYTIKARKIKGKFYVDELSTKDGIFNIQDIIDNNFPLCFESNNKDSALEMGKTILTDINEDLPKYIFLSVSTGLTPTEDTDRSKVN